MKFPQRTQTRKTLVYAKFYLFLEQYIDIKNREKLKKKVKGDLLIIIFSIFFFLSFLNNNIIYIIGNNEI